MSCVSAHLRLQALPLVLQLPQLIVHRGFDCTQLLNVVFVVCDLLLLIPIIVQLVAGDMRVGVGTAVVADVGQIVVRDEGEDDEGRQQDKNQFDW